MRALLAATALMLAPLPALAGPVFVFTQTGSTPPGAVYQATGSIELSGAAFGQGIAIAVNQTMPTPDWTALGILGLSFTTNRQSFGLADLVQDTSPPGVPLFWTVELQSGHAGTPTGIIYFNNSDWDVRYTLNGTASSGAFNTDFLGANGYCNQTGTCSFTGTFARDIPGPIPVPEPFSLVLLSAGLLALGAVRRR